MPFPQDEKDLLVAFPRHWEDYPNIRQRAAQLVEKLRHQKGMSLQDFLKIFPLSTPEGKSLMELMEGYLRIPDALTRDAFLADKILQHSWDSQDKGFLGLLSSYGLKMSKGPLGRHIISWPMPLFMKWMAGQFVMAPTIEDALKKRQSGFSYSFDMLGEGARTWSMARAYLKSYHHALETIGKSPDSSPAISVKLSALHPKYYVWNRENVLRELTESFESLLSVAKKYNIGLTIDAEESWRLELSLDLLKHWAKQGILQGFQGLGYALQAYQKKAYDLIDFFTDISQTYKIPLTLRLVKGAYWDTEIKAAQQDGLDTYPVFTRKSHTDISYLACAHRLFESSLGRQFATHNALTVAAIEEMSKGKPFEFQRLYGMGQGLYEHCRIYAPVGSHETLLPYLVRRMLENGANSSFVHALYAEPTENLLQLPHQEEITFPDPRETVPHKSAKGIDLRKTENWDKIKSLQEEIIPPSPSLSVDEAFKIANQGHVLWSKRPLQERTKVLETFADLVEENPDPFLYLLLQEGGKTYDDAISEWRETIDYARYYALQAQSLRTHTLPGPTGEKNELSFHPRGVFACISPWNFPLAIFSGQILAALVTGNGVVAKPASATPKIAHLAKSYLLKAGLPPDVLQILEGPSQKIGSKILEHPLLRGISFTGSSETARHMALTLAKRQGPLIPFIAETGGINAMIADTTILPEQLLDDVMISAFKSAGQRCSALRLLCLPKSLKASFLPLLKEAVEDLKVGSPFEATTEIGPVIDDKAFKALEKYISGKDPLCRTATDLPSPYVAPTVILVDKPGSLQEEVFGPVLHVCFYEEGKLENLIDGLNSRGYGLTMGLHSRVASTIEMVREKAEVGNLCINRSMIGAVVGVQPFGGEKLSGTGPKAGGPYTLLPYITERTFTENTAATGGNLDLWTR